MRLALKLKIFLVILLTLLAGILLLPTFVPDLPGWFTKYIYRGQLKLGLDLKGGVHLVLKPDLEKALQNQFENYLHDIKQTIERKGITYELQYGRLMATLKLQKAEDLELLKREILPGIKEIYLESEKREGSVYVANIALSAEREKFVKENLVNQLLEVLRNRIDQFGVAEPIITKQGTDKVVIQLPGVKDPERAMRIIGQTAQLEFKLVDDEAMKRIDLNTLISTFTQEGRIKDINNLEEWRTLLRPYLPPDTEFYFEVQKDRESGNLLRIPILLKRETLLTGDYLKDAQVRIDPNFNEPYVWIQFNDRGAKIFEAITSTHVGKRLAIVLDDVVRSAPVIKEKIAGGEAQITGSFTMEEAKDLSVVLRAGALPAPVKILQNITIGPSLGKDSIEKGIKAGLIGAGLVILFAIIYYKLSGFIAVIALLLNIYYLLALLSAFQATLTLPGIAGIILSIGMGIDSNVLIFERIREELRLGRTSYSAVFQGYSKAFWTIFDAHITVLLTSLILFFFGTGPIRGFAVTLSISILVNLFTAIFVTKIFYEILYEKGRDLKISFLRLLEKPNFNFMCYKKLFAIFSIILTLLGLTGFVMSLMGKANLGIDFTGGTILYLKTNKTPDLDKVRSILKDSGFPDVTLQDVKGENLLLLKMKSGKESLTEEVNRLLQTLSLKISDYKFQVLAKEEIGGVISQELQKKALLAILGAVGGIILYLSFRFNFYFGVAAGLATFHDVIAVFAIFYLLGLEINLLFITALLTIAGYSLTDTVVIFDRIREVILRGEGESDFDTLINKSLNEVFSRTIITTLTTLFGSLALLLFGGIVIRDFALALTLGFIVGTYSSIFIASPLLKLFHKGKIPELKSKEELL
ncbi:preprotein translocase subunit SecF [Caldimicrobium thiodismutans]|uniref:Multifunctional fusion protein n=1 Tax=Caldimicrobium thiodismutans TaxID=1653476 RepID=A0A0U4N3S7_9BACT|nr:protein translocase subunit SecDF [Caldimicrobium thiodismutans]BAU23942.1 preprotein translocase subunit SecF [Caldimicrobium thiodismutans]